MTSLAFIQLKRTIFPSFQVSNPPDSTSNERQILDILNWIALFFVRDPIGDCVASALFVEKHKITLYLAANRGRPDDKDVQNGNKLISVFCQALREPHSHERCKLLLHSALSITYLRFYHKLNMIKNMRFPLRKIDSSTPAVPPIEMFEKLITKWTEANGVEQNQELIKSAHAATLELGTYEPGEEGINALKAFFDHFVEKIPSQSDFIDQKKGSFWGGFCLYALLLVNSDFFSRVVPNDVEAAKLFNADERNWLRKLERRLRCIANYRKNAWLIATTGMKWIRRILGDEFTEGGDCFRIAWVGLDHDTLPKNHGMKYEIEERPQELFWKSLVHCGSTNKNVQTFMADLKNQWLKPKPNTTPQICSFSSIVSYCVIGYLDRHSISVHKYYT